MDKNEHHSWCGSYNIEHFHGVVIFILTGTRCCDIGSGSMVYPLSGTFVFSPSSPPRPLAESVGGLFVW